MGKNIKSVTASLRLGTCREKDIKDAIQYLKELDIALLSEKRLEIADLYYEILKQIQLLYASQEIEIPEEIMMDIRQLFDNIQGICSEPKEREASEAAFSVIMFLAYLRGHNCLTGDNDFSNTDEAIQKVWALRTDLGTIQFIFDLRVEGQLYFPIENMLVSVIKDDQFVEEMSNIDSGHIKVLYLAVHFFDEEEQKRQILTNIVNACNLKFIEYMQNQSELLDTQDLHNYRKNGVIIFIDSSRRKILIRHNAPEYFKGAENIQYENSFKNKERRIGYYVELDIPEGAARASFEDVMKKQPEKRMELLKLFYSGYKNIFGKYHLLEQEGEFLPVNPFANKDRFAIDVMREVPVDTSDILLERYVNLSVKRSASWILNRLTVGTIVQLLKIDDKTKDEVFGLEYSEEDFYQNQLLQNWILSVHDRASAMRELLNSMYMELRYCVRRKNDGNKDEVSIEKHTVCAQKYLPFYLELSKLLYLLNDDIQGKKVIVQEAAINSKTKGIILLEENPVRTVNETEIAVRHTGLEELKTGQSCYVIVDEDGNVYLEDQKILKAIYGLQMVMENCLHYDTVKEVDEGSYDRIKDGIMLHKDGLSESITENVFPESCFEEQICYRLIHNMIYSGIHTGNVKDYLKIFKKHQLLDFHDIKNDEYFQMKYAETLYVPKDSFSADSTLGSIFLKYLKKKAGRDQFELYEPHITYDEGQQKYMLGEKEIKHIVFLSDNFERGSATTVMLSAYLDLDGTDPDAVDNAKTRIQSYRYDKNGTECRMDLADVMKKNQCDITVHAYYGTEEAKKCISQFLIEQGYDEAKVSFQYAITCKMKQLKENVKAVWGEYRDGNDEKFAVIREFNMTKANVFPKKMLDSPEKAICLYLLKKETKKKIEKKQEEGELLGVEGLKQYFRKNGINRNSERTNTELYLFSTLPPTIRIEVLEDYLQKDSNALVLEKLSKAYGKADQLEKLKERLADWIEKGYTDQNMAEMLYESAEILNRYADRLPIAKGMEQARANFDAAMSVVKDPVDEEFREIMQSIFNEIVS